MWKKDIRTITIDFWDTIFVYPDIEPILKIRVEYYHNIFRKYNNITKKQTYDTVVSIYSFFEKIWNEEHRTPSTKEMIIYTTDKLNLQGLISTKEIDDLVTFNEELIGKSDNLVLIKDADVIIKKLFDYGYDLIIISDTGFEPGRELRKMLLKYDLLKYFTFTIFSDETGFSKPDKQAFQLALDKSSKKISDFGNMIHIGDREDKDILGANSAGMQSILFAGTRDNDYETTIANFKVKSWLEIGEIFNLNI